MKYLLHLTLGLLFITACSPRKGEEATQSTDTLTIVTPDSLPAPMNCKMYKADTASLPGIVQEFIQAEEAAVNDYFALRVTSQGHEYRMDATWYFDSAFRLRYYMEDWVSEAQGGTNQYVFCDDRLHAFYENTGYDGGVQDIVEAYNMIGLSYTYDETASITGEKKLLDSQQIIDKQVELVKKLGDLLKRLDEQGAIVDGEIRIDQSEEVSYGEDFTVTETFTCTLDTAVFRVIYKY